MTVAAGRRDMNLLRINDASIIPPANASARLVLCCPWKYHTMHLLVTLLVEMMVVTCVSRLAYPMALLHTDKDMFWPEPFDADAAAQNCQRVWGVSPRRIWATQEWGGRRCGGDARAGRPQVLG